MKTKLVPLFFPSRDDQFQKQINYLEKVLADYAEISAPLPLGADIPNDADAVLFPQILGDAYSMAEEFRSIRDKGFPVLVITSAFGSFSMWDWEINNFLKTKGIDIIMPHDLETSVKYCKYLGVKKELKKTKFRVYQDTPGDGMQSWIFKCFYWWGDECTNTIRDRLGIEIQKKSYGELAKKAAAIPDSEAAAEWKKWDFNVEGLSDRAVYKAVKMFLALERDMDDDAVKAMGVNCLNESALADTTPCLAWNMLYEKYGMIWACEADTMVMANKYLLYKCLESPIMMTNIYPFLMGKSATAHEKIPGFPEFIKNPEDHILLAHCGYFGLVPRSFCSSWVCKPPVLEIVNEDSHMFDARFPEGPMTMAKFEADLKTMFVVEGDLEGYIQYDESSDCRNGGILKVPDGYALLDKVPSHHLLCMTGNQKRDIGRVGSIFDFNIESV